MRRWSETAERVDATTRTSGKTAILAACLAGLTPDELPVAAVFLTGRPFPEAGQRSLGAGWSGLAGAPDDALRVADAPDDALRAAYDRSSDISTAVTAVLALEDRPGEATITLFHPFRFMPASPAEDAAGIMARLCSRDLHDISGQFPEVLEGARGLPWAGILDGEILAWDVLGLDTSADREVRPMLQLPLQGRRRILEALALPLAAARVRVRDAVPAHRPAPPGQPGTGGRHAGRGPGAVRRAAGGCGPPGDGERQEVARTARTAGDPGSGPGARSYPFRHAP